MPRAVARASWGAAQIGVVVAPDGSLVISDDHAGTLYRIAYSG